MIQALFSLWLLIGCTLRGFFIYLLLLFIFLSTSNLFRNFFRPLKENNGLFLLDELLGLVDKSLNVIIELGFTSLQIRRQFND